VLAAAVLTVAVVSRPDCPAAFVDVLARVLRRLSVRRHDTPRSEVYVVGSEQLPHRGFVLEHFPRGPPGPDEPSATERPIGVEVLAQDERIAVRVEFVEQSAPVVIEGGGRVGRNIGATWPEVANPCRTQTSGGTDEVRLTRTTDEDQRACPDTDPEDLPPMLVQAISSRARPRTSKAMWRLRS
jgi:hypothetical protein